MMTGNNELRLNQATMVKAIEYYLNEVVFATGSEVEVKEVVWDYTNSVYTVSFGPKVETDGH